MFAFVANKPLITLKLKHEISFQLFAGSLWLLAVVSVESREAHLNMLVMEAEQKMADLAAQAQRDGLSMEACQQAERLQSWEWRTKLYKRMRIGFQHARK